MKYEFLDKVDSVEDLKALPEGDIDGLCTDIRSFLLEKVGECGGHLASNLGVTELSVAIHRVFDSPKDHVIFDVGHQAYIHKIITGRKNRFDELRKPGGLSGFTLMRESEHDAFGAGHSSTSISAALGYAEGDKLLGKDNYTVCVVGDGAYTGGMIHEAINNCRPDLNLIIVLNENGMSISTTRGAFASYLSRVRMSKGYTGWKRTTSNVLNKIPLLGKPIKSTLSFFKNLLKKLIFKQNYFEELGLYYLGPIDGNDYKKVEWALTEAKRMKQCVFVHLKTTKGKGCDEAEQKPEAFHSVVCNPHDETFHGVFADKLIELAENDDRILAVTAAMGVGTGLNSFEQKFPERYYDVGIAEEHALTFSAGLAANGFKPFTAIYSTFLQRGYDNIIHDIALQNLPVRMFIDRAGLATSDGATHHGIFDVAFLSHIPGVEILAPITYGSLRAAVEYALDAKTPIAVRYPNASESQTVAERFYAGDDRFDLGVRCDFDVKNPPKCIFVTYGKLVEKVLEAEDSLNSEGKSCGTVLVQRIKPFGELVTLLADLLDRGCSIVYAEEGIKNGGAAMITQNLLFDRGYVVSPERFRIAAIDDDFVTPDVRCDMFDYAGLSSQKLKRYFE